MVVRVGLEDQSIFQGPGRLPVGHEQVAYKLMADLQECGVRYLHVFVLFD